MKVKGHNVKARAGASYVSAFRFYGTREVERGPGGVAGPKPGTWEPVCDVPVTVRGGRLLISDFELEHTRRGGWRFYVEVLVGADGRETWPDEGEEEYFTFPAEMVGRVDEVTYAALMLYNLEQKGVIAPGQL